MDSFDPAGGHLRPLNRPRPTRVVADAEGRPVRVESCGSWRGVTSIRESWRIDDEWWRMTISRIYYAVVLDEERLATLYRDLVTGDWYLQAE